MDRKNYIKEAQRLLSDTTTYTQIDQDPVFKIAKKIQTLLDHNLDKGVIDKTTQKYLKIEHPITPVFYHLPKIHKSLHNPPGRPIVASTDSILSPLAKHLEKILTPLVKSTRSYLQDTGHFLDIIHHHTTISPDSLLVTLDVNSLYTSITHDLGISAVETLLSGSNLTTDEITFCLDSLTIILKDNYFLFGDQFYLQTRGTAMGSNVAPPYANAYMAQFEEMHVYPNHLFQHHATIWYRYIDDIFCLWNGDIDTLLEFIDYLNNIRNELQFTCHHDKKQVSFLDTMVIITDQLTISTDLYTKPTDRNSLLQYQSCHPRHIKHSLPKSQYTRVQKIVSDPDTRQKRLHEMSHKFKQRGYPDQVLSATFSQPISGDTNRHPKQPKPPRLPFVHTYHPVMPKIQQIIRQHWSILQTYYEGIPEFQCPPLMCTKKPQSLRNNLVRADIGTQKPQKIQSTLHPSRKGTFPCLHCIHCSNVIKGQEITHPRTGEHFQAKGHYTCDSTFVIYLIKCPCGLIYVGETSQKIKSRIASHKSTIRCKKTWLPPPHHFEATHHTIAQLRFQVLEQVPRPRRGGNHIQLLKERESYWIHRMNCVEPYGLNRDFNVLIH